MGNKMINYTNRSKAYAICSDNYVGDVRKTQNRTNCYNCIFAGENKSVSEKLLCAKYQNEIAEVEPNATCDSGRGWFSGDYQVELIKQLNLKLHGFVFKNR